MKVIPITKAVADAFVTAKHYSRRACIFWAGFGLVEHGCIMGVCVYGQPSPPINRSAFRDRDFRLFELSRLVVQTETRNAASYLVGNSLQMLEPKPCAVISYADSEMGHAGIVYQATNWTYTGATVSHDHMYLIDGKRVHPMQLTRGRGIKNPKEWARANGIQTVKPMPKHRYFQFVGNRRQVRDMRAKLTYPVVPEYPKAPRVRYEDGPFLYAPADGGTVTPVTDG